jgi:arylsulfatase A-like enzyme
VGVESNKSKRLMGTIRLSIPYSRESSDWRLPMVGSLIVVVLLVFGYALWASGNQADNSKKARAVESGREPATAQSSPILPFPETPSASMTGRTLKESKHKWRTKPQWLPKDAPNIVMFMTDDAGFSNPECFGGPVHMPTMSKLAKQGITYNAFHTTAMCSPTRAALMTGRNHHRVGYGTIAELAADWDGYIGRIPRSAATVAQVLGEYGYATGAFGKWHNTPIDTLTPSSAKDQWPTGLGFNYFYGFIAGETSQYEPRIWENTNPVEPPHDPEYHFTADMADHAIDFMRKHRSLHPERPFLAWFTPGAVHGPHHVQKKWGTNTRGSSTRAGRNCARKQSADRRNRAGSPKMPSSRPSTRAWRS